MRLAALVSAIKAAHLTMFSLFGYAYATSMPEFSSGMTSSAGSSRTIAGDPLGLRYSGNALSFFREFRHMLRPVQGDLTELEGTLTDGIVRLCADSSGLPWGMVVFVRTAQWRHAVLLPFPGNPDAIATFYQFLGNDRTSVNFMAGRFESSNGRWLFDPKRIPGIWPKSGDLYPTSID